MSHDRPGCRDNMDVDDFEELLADMPNDDRWELIRGRVVRMMVGVRWQHNVIIQNLAGALRQRFRAQISECRTFTETFFMTASWLKTATLPDITIRCGKLPKDATSLDDPKVLIERDHAVIDVFDRAGDAWAICRTIERLESDSSLPAVDVSVPVSEIYEDVLSA